MKISAIIWLCLLPAALLGQEQDSTLADYKIRLYDPRIGGGCICPALFNNRTDDGRMLLPDDHPSAPYCNDPKYWHWRNITDDHPEFGGVWDVKPEYLDSIQRYDGSWFTVAFWTVERWKREEEEQKLLDSLYKKHNGLKYDYRYFGDYLRSLKRDSLAPPSPPVQ